MTDYKRLTFAISLILFVLVLAIPACSGEEPPSTDVMAMGGSLIIDSKTPPLGTIITAMSGDEVLGTVSTEAGGIFGDESWNKICIYEPSGIDKITLYAELDTGSVVIADGIDWSQGNIQIDINAVTDSTNDDGSSVSRSSSSSSSSYTIITPTDDDDEAVAGGEGVESDTPISAHTVTPTTESTSTTGETGSSSNTVLIVGIIIIVAVVAFVIYQKSKY